MGYCCAIKGGWVHAAFSCSQIIDLVMQRPQHRGVFFFLQTWNLNFPEGGLAFVGIVAFFTPVSIVCFASVWARMTLWMVSLHHAGFLVRTNPYKRRSVELGAVFFLVFFHDSFLFTASVGSPCRGLRRSVHPSMQRTP